MSQSPADGLLGHLDWDRPNATSERAVLRAPDQRRDRIQRNRFVRIDDVSATPTSFLGRIVAGPFFPGPAGAAAGPVDGTILAEIEIQGELIDGRPHDTSNRPAPGSAVHELRRREICDLLGFSGDMVLGTISGREDLPVGLGSKNKDVLPRNLGIFGTVGSGKSNTTQVLIEEAAANGWAVIVLDVEGEYVEMDGPRARRSCTPGWPASAAARPAWPTSTSCTRRAARASGPKASPSPCAWPTSRPA